MTKEALKSALKAYLCREMPAGTVIGDPKWWAAKIAAAIKEALAQPEQEPVAWAMLHDNGHFIDAIHPDEHARVEGKYIHPLYTTPPQRTWVGLTDEEIWTVLQFRGYNTDTIEIAKAIEAKLRSKNICAKTKSNFYQK